jgi:nucleoside-diphosphate-sugar epimerase
MSCNKKKSIHHKIRLKIKKKKKTMSEEQQSQQVSVLILGGLGMIGRAFLQYLCQYKLATHIRVVDKKLPQMAYLNPDQEKLLNQDGPVAVEYLQANLAAPEHAERAFTPSGKCQDIGSFQLVVNLAAMTEYGRPEEMYKVYILELRVLCAKLAAAKNVDMYVEVSTGQVYAGESKTPAREDAVCKPWTLPAKYHKLAEEALANIPGLNYCILRLANVYGPGDVAGLMPRMACAAVYEHVGATMEFLWGEELRVNSIHVQDVSALLWHLCAGAEVGQIYNGVDDSDLTQGEFNKIMEQVFKVKTNCRGSITSMIASMKIEEIVEEANGGHMGPWRELLQQNKIGYTPVDPYLVPELLSSKHLCLDGSKIKATGFQLSCPKLTKELVVDSVKYWAKMNLFPAAKHPEFLK